MKLKLNTGAAIAASANTEPPTPTPSTSIKLKFGKPAAVPPAILSSSPPPLATTLKLKTSKAPPKSASETKKRPRADENEDTVSIAPLKKQNTGTKFTLSAKPLAVKTSVIKLKGRKSNAGTPITPGQTRLKIKAKGKLPPRPRGVGYDSEAEDAELDPANEDNLVLRMAPGPDCDYLRDAIENRKVGLPVSQGGADISMRFFSRDARRAVVNIREKHYAAILVDLPCIIESMKSWDKRGWWKSADICQMLMVLGQVEVEEAAKTFPLPKELDTSTWQWPHGLTPPMHNVRNRRFRKRVSNRTIEAAEEEVERLLAEDEKARVLQGTVEWKVLDLDAMRREEGGEDEYDDDDAEGDADDGYFGYEEDEAANAEALARLEQALGADDEEEGTTEVLAEVSTAPDGTKIATLVDQPAADPSMVLAEKDLLVDADTSTTQVEVGTEDEGAAEEDEEDDDEDDEEEEEEEEEEEQEEEEIDDDARQRAQEDALKREEITYLEGQIAMSHEALKKVSNPMLRRREEGKIKSLQADLEVKKRQLGIVDDDG